ncbi:MAG: hypothetical protein ACOCUH_03535, partial [Bacteriovoracia bacterium]
VTVCVERGTVTHTKTDIVTLKFKAPKVMKGEEDTFTIRAKQQRYDGNNVIYSMTPVEVTNSYQIDTKEFFGDKIILKQGSGFFKK